MLNKVEETINTRDQTAEFMHCVYCSLVALRIAQKLDGVGTSKTSETKFLGQWYISVLKRRVFNRSINQNLQTIVDLYKLKGMHSGIVLHLNEIYGEYFTLESVKNKTFNLPFKDRVTKAFDEIAKDERYLVQVPLDYDPRKLGPYKPVKKHEVFVIFYDYWEAFKDDELVEPLRLYTVGDPADVVDAFHKEGVLLQISGKNKDKENAYYLYTIHPDNKFIENVMPCSYYIV